jgi:hypothetical protein
VLHVDGIEVLTWQHVHENMNIGTYSTEASHEAEPKISDTRDMNVLSPFN